MKIKICGLTKPEEAGYLNRNHVDFAGMVLFFPKSKRCISLEQAEKIKKKLDPSIHTVAVVVSPSLEQAMQIENAGFDYLQIHGDIPENLFEYVKLPVLKAFNIKDMKEYEKYRTYEGIHGFVFDAQEPGSGKTFEWSLLKTLVRDEKWFFLAGGLSTENVQQAIDCIHPDGVDVSSGVEYTDKLGKDGKKIDEFVAKVRGEMK